MAEQLMNYDAASVGRRTADWRAPASDADTASRGSRARLRQLSRDMIRNRSMAVRGQSVVSGNVVATGIVPSINASDRTPEEVAQMMEVVRGHLMTRAIDARGVSALPGLQRQVMNAVFQDGEVLVRRRQRNTRLEPGLKLPFAVELLEVDHLDTTVTSNGQNEVVDGIEYGPTGAVVAYHIYDTHPGDLSGSHARAYRSTRVSAESVLHIRRIDRPGQMRGVPWLAPVMLTMADLADYQESQILKQKVASLMAFFVEAGDDGVVYDGKDISEVGPGSVVGLKAGQKMVPATPPTVEGYDQFMREGIRSIATGLGLTYESFGDLSGVNFSSGRMGRMEMDRFIQVWQQEIMIDQFCRGIERWTLDAWRLVQSAVGQAPDQLEWTAPRRPLIDPTKEVSATVQQVEAGLTSLQRAQRELGHDPDVIARERAEDAARITPPAQQGE